MVAAIGMTRRLAIVALASLFVSCRGAGLRHESFVVAAPLADAQILRAHLHVRLSPGRPLSDVITVPIDPLKPDMTITEARRILGDPLATRTDAEGTYYLFRTQPVAIELAHLTGAGSNRGTRRYWSVAGGRGSVSVVFGPAIRELITRAKPVQEIVIHEQGRTGRAAFSADIDGEQVSRLRWYSIVDMPG
jgi:hypothetical protein